MKRAAIAVGVLGLLLAGVWLAGPRVEVGPPEDYPAPPVIEALDGWLDARESLLTDLTPGTAARVVWARPDAPAQTPLAVIHLHGFSATRQETAPLAEQVAAGLGANLFEARLRGHGRSGAALAEASVEQWFADALQALAIGRVIGQRVVILGVSTGGTLGAWLAARPEAKDGVEALVLISPNFGPRDRRSRLLTGPWGRQIAEAIIGEERSWTPENERRRTFWTWRYPTRALLPMMALVEATEALPTDAIRARTLVLYSPHDPTLDVGAIVAWAGAAPGRTPVAVEDDIPGANHVLAGDILAPQRTGRLTRQIVAFIGREGE